MRTHRALAVAVALTAAAGLWGPAALAGTPGDQDETFVVAAHQSNLSEIAAGQDAGRHAESTCVKEAGARLVADHTKLDSELTALAGKLGIELPTAPTAEQQQKLKEVQEEAGTPEYDDAWLVAQESGHDLTLELIDKQIDEGQNAEVTAAAEKARPIVAMHLDMVRDGTCHSM
ncbi:DUF4142 domain-containing protein [Streptomyces sp. NPDC012888]|uniref:DUF4142 domain-containing protein n=1 Tax=Streptomyces sp. NPDC012888 TaxID=3364855 RepID=UPI0036A75F9C